MTPGGPATVLASGVAGANVVVETPSGRLLASASLAGTIVDVTDGTPVVRASGLSFPNGLAVGKDGLLYVAETTASRVSRMTLAADGTLGPPTTYAGGLLLADGIGFDRAGNLFVVGGGTLAAVVARTGAVVTFPTDPLINWASNLAFGRGRGFKRRDVYLANYGPVRRRHDGHPLPHQPRRADAAPAALTLRLRQRRTGARGARRGSRDRARRARSWAPGRAARAA